jgi:ParB-like chromosome segregation protein Spo0J
MACDDSRRLRLDVIPLADLRPGDDRFRITVPDGRIDLRVSIARIGLLNPVLVLPGGRGPVLVSGHRRAAACADIGWTRIPARLLPTPTGEYECAIRAVGENSLERSLSVLESARALALLDRCHPDANAPGEDLAALGLPTNPALRERLKRLTALSPEIQSGVAEETIAFPTACELAALNAQDAARIARLLRRLQASLNKQREILQLIVEIAKREGTTPREVMSDPLLGVAIEGAGDDRHRITGAVRRFLRHRRFPEIDAAQKNFEGLRRRLSLGEDIHLEPPPGFEGTRYLLGCSFERREDLVRLRDRLDRLMREPALEAILQAKGRGFKDPC